MCWLKALRKVRKAALRSMVSVGWFELLLLPGVEGMFGSRTNVLRGGKCTKTYKYRSVLLTLLTGGTNALCMVCWRCYQSKHISLRLCQSKVKYINFKFDFI